MKASKEYFNEDGSFDWESYWADQATHLVEHVSWLGERMKFLFEQNRELRCEIAKLKEKNG